MTDERSGDNAKSTFLDLVKAAFGDLVLIDNKLVCSGSFESNKHSHDAAFLPVRGKRIIIAEELKSHQTLDSGFLKRISGGDEPRIAGRGFGTAEHFEFVSQARIFIVFNQGDCPKFDAKDSAFVGRMVVVPMQSKFVTPDILVGAAEVEPHTFSMDMTIKAHFPLWRSALLAIMMERHVAAKVALARPPPATAKAWQSSVASGNNPLADWLATNYEVTGDKTDTLLLSDVKARYDGRAVQSRDFVAVAGAYFKGVVGASVHDFKRLTTGDPPTSKMLRNVVLGARTCSRF